jgi:hypothetical protein
MLGPLDANMQTSSPPKFTFIGLHVCIPLFYFEIWSFTSKKGKANLLSTQFNYIYKSWKN